MNQLLNAINNADNICVSAHTNPDGDAIGSTLALTLCLLKLNKQPILLLEDYSECFNVLNGKQYIYKGDYSDIKCDLFFSLDCGSVDRLGNAKSIFENAKIKYNIDHHFTNTNFGDINIIDCEASSTCEVLYEIIKDIVPMDIEIASSLYAGILTDTGGFRHNSTKKRTHEIAGALVELGINTSLLNSALLLEHSEKEAHLLSEAIAKMTVDCGVCYSYITLEELRKYNADKKDVGAIIDYLINIRGVNIAFFLYEKEDGKVKLSMRSKDIDISDIAVNLGGGGHKLAAGADMNENIVSAVNTVCEMIKRKI